MSTRAWLWSTLGRRLMAWSFHNWYGLRRRWLQLFGAALHDTCRIRPSAIIIAPWNLSLGEESSIGDRAIVNCTCPVTIGRRCTISQYAHLCTDERTSLEGRRTGPITIDDDVWIATDVYVGPGVRIGADSVVGSRSTVRDPLPGGMICGGDHARPLAPRTLRLAGGAA